MCEHFIYSLRNIYYVHTIAMSILLADKDLWSWGCSSMVEHVHSTL